MESAAIDLVTGTVTHMAADVTFVVTFVYGVRFLYEKMVGELHQDRWEVQVIETD